MNIKYTGENIFPGDLGRFFICLALVTSLVALVSFIISGNRKNGGRLASIIGRYAFVIHTVSITAAGLILYHLIFRHSFEYRYVWQYSSVDLPLKYIISCFWAGQEGSFIVWTFLQAVLGVILVFILARKWQGPVMAMISLSQIFLSSMLLGLTIGDYHIGSSPFVLLRDTIPNLEGTIFMNPDYVKNLVDGNGLNPLLENYWMITHPPVLFLGYASALIPFGFAIAGLWNKDYSGWIRPAIPWTVFSILVLGAGILLGGRWAYESLTFGGFWAWDPVENASLVPWLVLVAGLHLMLVSKKHNYALLNAFLFISLSYVLVIYASFLTRSGILGDTSAHSFGGDGRSIQLIIFNIIFLMIPLIMIINNAGNFPKKNKDHLLSREFFIFLGAVILILSSFQILLTTSIPAVNKLLGTHIAPPIQREDYYNTWQLPFALLMAFFIGIAQFMRYGRNEFKVFTRKIAFPAIIAIVMSVVVILVMHISRLSYILFTVSMIFSLVVSLDYFLRFVKEYQNTGATITHIGFVIFSLGVLLTFSNAEVISRDRSTMGRPGIESENQLLERGKINPMGEYFVLYNAKKTIGRETFYELDFYKAANDGSYLRDFTLTPSINRNERMGNVYNPDTRHFLDKDIFCYIVFASMSGNVKDNTYVKTQEVQMFQRDTVSISPGKLVLDSLEINHDLKDISLDAYLKIITDDGKVYASSASYLITGQVAVNRIDGFFEELGVKIRFENTANTSVPSIVLGIYIPQEDYIVVKAIIHPNINLVWGGALLLFTGLIISILQRIRKKRQRNTTASENFTDSQ